MPRIVIGEKSKKYEYEVKVKKKHLQPFISLPSRLTKYQKGQKRYPSVKTFTDLDFYIYGKI